MRNFKKLTKDQSRSLRIKKRTFEFMAFIFNTVKNKQLNFKKMSEVLKEPKHTSRSGGSRGFSGWFGMMGKKPTVCKVIKFEGTNRERSQNHRHLSQRYKRISRRYSSVMYKVAA